jgi:hypothetical protein
MPRKPIEISPAAARTFVKDMRAFHAAKTGLEKDATRFASFVRYASISGRARGRV